MTRSLGKLRRIPVLSLLFGLMGCAVLKIDVDVYKGPLANHESVQMQQMAVMAIGAKPLLSELLALLERRSNPEFYIVVTNLFSPSNRGDCHVVSIVVS